MPLAWKRLFTLPKLRFFGAFELWIECNLISTPMWHHLAQKHVHHWRLNDLCSCSVSSRQSQSFSVGGKSPESAPFCGGSGPPSDTWFLEPTLVHIPNHGHMGDVVSAIFAGLTVVPSIWFAYTMHLILCSYMWPIKWCQYQWLWETMKVYCMYFTFFYVFFVLVITISVFLCFYMGYVAWNKLMNFTYLKLV